MTTQNMPKTEYLTGGSMEKTYSRRDAARSILSAGAVGLAAAHPANAAGQPHMQAAPGALQNADNALQNAEPDKAGHRAKALQLVKQAINQVQAGIQAGAK